MKFGSEKDFQQYLRRVWENPAAFGVDVCILCHGRANGMGTFIPNAESHAKFGGKPGMGRVGIYGLCETCRRDDQSGAKVEAALAGGLNARVM